MANFTRVKYVVSTGSHWNCNTHYYITTVTRCKDGVTVQFIPNCETSAACLVRDTFCIPYVFDGSIITFNRDIRTMRQYKFSSEGARKCTDSKTLKQLFRTEVTRLKGGK
jgi:hypothetical protein